MVMALPNLPLSTALQAGPMHNLAHVASCKSHVSDGCACENQSRIVWCLREAPTVELWVRVRSQQLSTVSSTLCC
jgi:hypothetical protein